MKRAATWIILTMATTALLLAMLPSLPALPTIYTDSFKVMNKIEYTAGSSVVSVEMKYESMGDGGFANVFYQRGMLPADYFKITGITGANGNQIATSWDPESQVWRVSAEGEVTVDYDINMEGLKSRPDGAAGFGDPAFSPFMPHWDDDYCFIPGGYLLLNPFPSSDNKYQASYFASFDLPEGWKAWPSWNVEGDTEGNAVNGAVFAGEASSVEVQGEIPLTVIQPLSADPANLAGQQEFAEKLAAQLQAANQAWGKPGIQGGRLLIYLGGVKPDTVDNHDLLSLPFPPLYGCAFIPAGGRENILSLDFLERGTEEELRIMLGGLYFDSEALWFREGCIHYSNLVFAQANSWISENDVYDQLGRDYAFYVDSLAQSGTSLAGAGEQAQLASEGEQALPGSAASLLYSGGTIAVTSIDVSLAKGDKRLKDLVASLFAEPIPIASNQDLQKRLESLSGQDFNAFVSDYITGDKVIPASSFSQLKLNQGSGEEANAGQNDIKPAPGFGRKWILILIAIGLVFALPFVLEPYTLRPRGGAEAFDHDVEGKKKSGGRWWSWEDEEDDEEPEEDDGGAEEEEALEPAEDAGEPESESSEAATPLQPEL